MTDPIVKQSLLDLVEVLRQLNATVGGIDERVRKLETEAESKRTRECYMPFNRTD